MKRCWHEKNKEKYVKIEFKTRKRVSSAENSRSVSNEWIQRLNFSHQCGEKQIFEIFNRTCSEGIPAHSRKVTISTAGASAHNEFRSTADVECIMRACENDELSVQTLEILCLPEDTIFSTEAQVGYFVSCYVKVKKSQFENAKYVLSLKNNEQNASSS